jgi:signal transduction histidine kinase/ligand-binding sensor domain-containing protein
MIPSEKYTSKNGLISDRVTAISQDEKGFMWFGSFFGICRYDGIKFEKIALPEKQQNKFVNCLLPAGNKMYAGFLFGGGLAEYANGKVTSYFIKTADSVSGNEFICMADNHDGSIILSSSLNDIYSFRNGVFQFIIHVPLGKGNARVLLRDGKKNIWVGSENGLFVIPYPYKKTYCYFSGENIFSMSVDSRQRIWFRMTNGITTTSYICEGWNSNGIQQLKQLEKSNSSRLISFAGNMLNGLWGIDYGKGLINIKENGSFTTYQAPIDYTTDLNVLYADRENNLWIANEPGIIKISNLNIKVFPFEEIAAGGGDIRILNDTVAWASNSKAIYQIRNNRIAKYQLPLKESDYYGLIFIDHSQNVWVGLWNHGIWRTRWSEGKIIQQEYISEFNHIPVKANAAVEDKSGNSWIIGGNGIFHIRGNKIIDQFQPESADNAQTFVNCFSIDEDNQVMWLGDNALGLVKVKYSFGKENKCSYKVIDRIGSKEGLPDTYIRSIYFDRNKNLWAGTRFGGIYRITASGNGYTIECCNQQAELSCTRVTDIRPEDTSAVCFATCNGVYKYIYKNHRWQHFNTSNGLLNSEIFRLAIDSNGGYVWAVSSQGITKFNTNEDFNTAVPLVNITAVNVLGKPDSSALGAGTRKYSSDENSIGFSFAGASFIDEKKIRYKYMLQGYDPSWSAPVYTNTVNYASLPPGKYTFRVLAANAEGQWSTQPATFSFEIIRPFYKSPILAFLFITLGIFIVYVLRIQRLKQRYKIERIRLNIARDLHDDIGSTLGSINLLSKTATRKMNNQTNAEEITPIFQKIGESAENTLEAMDDIVWSINPNKDTIYDLVIRMREFAIPLFEAKNIDFSFQVEGDKELPVPMNLRRNVFLIYKESIHNIMKHSDASTVYVIVNTGHHHFRMSIVDNGKGFTESEYASRRNGLKNMQGRAEMVGGNIDFHTSGEGTHIEFEAPLR